MTPTKSTNRRCDNCGKPSFHGDIYCPPCERIYGENTNVVTSPGSAPFTSHFADPGGFSLRLFFVNPLSHGFQWAAWRDGVVWQRGESLTDAELIARTEWFGADSVFMDCTFAEMRALDLAIMAGWETCERSGTGFGIGDFMERIFSDEEQSWEELES